MAEDYANRLRKNLKKFEKWAKQEGIECYRLYDADLPEYNVAVDRYADWVVIQEYAPPKPLMRKSAPAHAGRDRSDDCCAWHRAKQTGAENPRASEREKPVSEDG